MKLPTQLGMPSSIPPSSLRRYYFLYQRQKSALQRVNRQFQGVIVNSTRIHQKLFLKSSPSRRHKWYYVGHGSSGESPIWHNGNMTAVRRAAEPHPRQVVPFTPVKICPLLSPGHDAEYWFIHGRWIDPSISGPLTSRIGIKSSGSWEGMFATDPPCTKASISLFWTLNSKPITKGLIPFHQVVAPAGVTLGSLVHAALHQVGRGNGGIYRVGREQKSYGNVSLVETLAPLERACGETATIHRIEIYLGDMGLSREEFY